MKTLSFTKTQKKESWGITIDVFKGVASLLDDVILGNKFAKEATNMYLVQDGRWKTRWGTANYGDPLPGDLKFVGCGIFETDNNVEEKIAIASNGKAYKSIGIESWDEIAGATFNTTAKKYSFAQCNGQLYICNGIDPLTRYNGTILLRYSQIPAPSNLAGTRNVLTAGNYNNFYRVTAINDVGETTGSNEINITTNKPRNSWNVENQEGITLTWNAVSGANRYQIYYFDEQGKECLLAETSTIGTTFNDNGRAVLNPIFIIPPDNTTGAPKFKMVAESGSRLWGITKDYVYWSGVGDYLGVFSDFYGGGWQPIVKGSGEKLEWIGHFRSGKGDNVVTAITRNAAGVGSVWQIPLEISEVAETTIIVPNPTKLPGPIGTVAMLGVVDANDSLYIPNSRGIFALNNKANITNILSTTELSGNVRPSFRDLKNIENIASIWYDSKIIFTASEGGEGNDIIFGLDTEQNEWFWKWTIGFKNFLEITESTGKTKLLGVPNDSNYLIEISENIKGDQGKPFLQSWTSGLIPISSDSTEFAKVQEALVELGRPSGTVNFEILGVEKRRGFISIATRKITGNLAISELWTGDLGEITLKDEEESPITYNQASAKKAKRVGKILNSIQFHIYSNDIDSNYTILKIQAKGTKERLRTPRSFYK